MGQTLTHGVYLPNEGERNCYSGLASNWRLLDGAIGTVAAHTTAIAGKADISHSHGNISNDGKVGTAANKPLITGTGGAVQAGSFGNQANTFCEGNDSRLSDARTPVAHTHSKSDVTDLFNSANVWTGLNTFSNAANCVFSFKFGSSGSYNDIRYYDSNDSNYACIRSKVDELNLGLKYSSGAAWYNGASVTINNTGTVQIKSYDGTENWTVNFTPVGVYPTSDKALELGTSTNKWKSFNGVNPGALSLPGEYSSSVTEYVTDKTGGNNVYTAPADGWVGIQANSATLDSDNFIFMGRTSDGLPYYEQNASSPITAYWSNLYHGCILLPVIGGKTYGIRCKCDTVDARFYKANGNVS